MPSILEEFAYGNVIPDIHSYKKDSRFGRAMKLVSQVEQKLLVRLGTADRDLFEKYVDAQKEARRLASVDNLVYGYKLGLVMTAEAFTGMDRLVGWEEV